jgi:hypothetical protein
MLSYDKLKKLLLNTLNCKEITPNVVSNNEGLVTLKYIKFITAKNIPCLLEVNDKYKIEISMSREKPVLLQKIQEPNTRFQCFLTQDEDNGIVKEISAQEWPEGYIELLNHCDASMLNIQYRTAISVENNLIIKENRGDEKATVFSNIASPLKTPQKRPELLLVVDLETIVKGNYISEIERVHDNLNKIIKRNNQEYTEHLLNLLKRCQELKIISQNNPGKCHIEQSMQTLLAHKAIKSALICFEKSKK